MSLFQVYGKPTDVKFFNSISKIACTFSDYLIKRISPTVFACLCGCTPVGGGGGGVTLTNIGYTWMFRPTAFSFSSPNSRTGNLFWSWTLGLGIIFA